jgi:hypothetical protein
MLTRRLFLGGLLTAATAPAIVRSGVLMPVKPEIIVPPAGVLNLDMLHAARRQLDAVHLDATRRMLAHGEAWLEYFGRQLEPPRAIVVHDTRTIMFRRQPYPT